MSDSREDSPDWLRCFQAPKTSFFTLSSSSDSEPSPSSSPIREDDIHQESPTRKKSQLSKKDIKQDSVLIDSGEESLVPNAPTSKSAKKRVKDETHNDEEGNEVKGKIAKKGTLEKPPERHFSSRMPLVMSEKVQRTKALVECDGESMDMSGDVGAVGRIIVSDTPSENPEMLFDLKGTIYKTTIVPSRTFCVVSFGQTEAKIEAVMNDFIQLKPQSNVFEAETMIEGTLEGFSFDSEEEAEKVSKPKSKRNDENDEAGEVTNSKTSGKADKVQGGTRKKGKTVAKPPKKGKRKTQATKKTKNAKK